MISDIDLVPLLADPALRSIWPILALLDVIMTKDSSENDFIHVASHWVLDEEIIGHLVDTHEHEGQLTCGSIVVLLDD